MLQVEIFICFGILTSRLNLSSAGLHQDMLVIGLIVVAFVENAVMLMILTKISKKKGR